MLELEQRLRAELGLPSGLIERAAEQAAPAPGRRRP
jgi:hypothetical protein